MGKLKILAGGISQQGQARGKLFEKLMAQVLRHYRYGIDRIPSVNYAGSGIGMGFLSDSGNATSCDILLRSHVEFPRFGECWLLEAESTPFSDGNPARCINDPL